MPPAKGSIPTSLILDYETEELTPIQTAAYNGVNDQLAAYNKKIEELSKSKDVLIESLGEMTLIEFQSLSPLSTSPMGPGKKVVLQPNQQNIVMVDQKAFNALLASSNAAASVASPSPVPSSPAVNVSVGNTLRFQAPPAPPVTPQIRSSVPRIRVRGGLSGPRGGGTAIRQRAPGFIARGGGGPRVSTRGGYMSPALAQPRAPVPSPPVSSPPVPTGDRSYVVDLTDEDAADDYDACASKADTKEVTISKNSEKTFPSLVVTARPYLGPKNYNTPTINAERNALDEKVKQVLGLTNAQLTEWLLQHGLLRSEQTCNAYGGRGKTHLPLKLGMYSDSSKFPFSGGYVWISECCPSQFVSVFSGSLLEAVPHPPGTMLKLIYHWACQTTVSNIVQWVKVDTLFVKTLFTNLRAVCTAAIHDKFPIFGGTKKRVQIGVISLGTTTHDGSSRQVKVEVLGILDDETQHIRIRAIEPIVPDPVLSSQEQMKKRFQKTLEFMPKWVDKNSEIIIDYTVDKQTLLNFGYLNVIQVSPDDTIHSYKIMDYLRKIIPRMFQNTLSLLSRQIIQQFLDELSWRESFGPISSRAFQSILEHIAEQTRLNSGATLLSRLSRISLNPFKNWAYDRWGQNCKFIPSSKFHTPLAPLQPKSSTSSAPSMPPLVVRKSTPGPARFQQGERESRVDLPTSSGQKKTTESSDPTMIALEPYYYGVLEGAKKNKYVPFFTQCYFCRADFKNVLKLTDHLILHALNKNLENTSDPKDICRACLKIRLPGSKQHHQQTCRSGPQNQSCRICALKMKDKGSLVYHMTKTHHQLDMPYLCGKCGFRVSEYDLLNQHFSKVHHNGISGMCPFCLKVIDFATEEGGDLEQNQVFFTKHIQRHALPSSKKCSRCLLNFVNKSILAAHEVDMHASQEDNEDVMRFLVDDPTLMPAPIMEPPLVHSVQPGDLKPTGLLKGISSVLLGVTASNIDEGLGVTCHECESPVNPDHFINYLMCNKCSFRTCCAHAMAEHVSLLHPPYPLSSPVYVGMKTVISQKTYCFQCSFTTRDGNKMSQHLVTCGSGTCSIGRKRPIRPESESIMLQPKLRKKRGRRSRANEVQEERVPSTSQPQVKNVLNSVGLVRKSTDDEASQEPQENEAVRPGSSEQAMEEDESLIDPSSSLLEIEMVEGASGVDTAPDVIPTVSSDKDDSTNNSDSEDTTN